MAAGEMKEEHLAIAIKEGRIGPDVIEALMMFGLSEEFGWLPSQVRKERGDDLNAYRAILAGIKKREIEAGNRRVRQGMK